MFLLCVVYFALMNPKTKGRRPAVSNMSEKDTYSAKLIEPVMRVPQSSPVFLASAGFEVVVTDSDVSIFNKGTDKIVFLITRNEIVIGNPDGEHIKLQQ